MLRTSDFVDLFQMQDERSLAHLWEKNVRPGQKNRRGVAAGHTRRMMAKGNMEGVGDFADTGVTGEGSRLGTRAG